MVMIRRAHHEIQAQSPGWLSANHTNSLARAFTRLTFFFGLTGAPPRGPRKRSRGGSSSLRQSHLSVRKIRHYH
jgi:hypothetical protein